MPAPLLPTKKKPGDAVKASDFNAIIDAVTAILNTRGTHPVDVSFASGGMRIGLVGSRRGPYDAVITAAPPPGVALLPSAAIYSVRLLDRPDLGAAGVLSGLTPRFRGMVKLDEVEIYPAVVNDPCQVWLWPTASGIGTQVFLHAPTEAVKWFDCP